MLASSGASGTLPTGVTVIEASADAVTVKTVDACKLLYVAPILVVPVIEFVVLASPEDAPMVATEVLDEAHTGLPAPPFITVTIPSV